MTNPSAGPDDDGWDWPWIIFMGRKQLGYSEQEIWSMTPRKYFALLDCAASFNEMKNSVGDPKDNKGKTKVKNGNIDDVKW